MSNLRLQTLKFNWVSEFNLEGKIVRSQVELGDGASSRVYIGMLNGMQIAVKQLKSYSPRFAAPSIVKRYEKLYTLNHKSL